MAMASLSSNYEPAKRCDHSTVIVGDCLYMWGGKKDMKDDHDPKHHCIESFVEVLHLPTGRWEQKPTTGDPPLGIMEYVAVAIGNEIFYYGGHCCFGYACKDCFGAKLGGDQTDCRSILYSLNVDTFKWKKIVPERPCKFLFRIIDCGMIAVKIEGEDYLVILQSYAIDIFYFRIATGQWIKPVITGGLFAEASHFNFMSVDDTSAILLEDDYMNKEANAIYWATFAKGSVVCTFHGNGKIPYLDLYDYRPNVLLNSPKGLKKLLFICGNQCETIDYNKTNWSFQKVDVPESVKNRICHSLSVWNEDTANTWIIEFGGQIGNATSVILSDTAFLKITYTKRGDISVKTYTLNEYQEEMKNRRFRILPAPSTTKNLLRFFIPKGEEQIMKERHQQEIQQLHLQMKERDQQAREREREMERQLQERETQLQQKIQELRIQNEDIERQFQEREHAATSTTT